MTALLVRREVETAAFGLRLSGTSRRVLELASEVVVLLLHTTHCSGRIRMRGSVRERAMQGGRA